MQLKNTEQGYGAVAKGFHWVIALLILGLLGLGLYMGTLKPGPRMFNLFALHKSFGITVLLLASMRLLWRLINTHPLPLPGHKQWERIMAKLVHGALYCAMFLMPLSGWVMSSAKGFSVSWFGLFTLPNFVPRDKILAHNAVEFHETLAWVLMGLIALHFAGAIKHHLIDRDGTLRRMLPGCGAKG